MHFTLATSFLTISSQSMYYNHVHPLIFQTHELNLYVLYASKYWARDGSLIPTNFVSIVARKSFHCNKKVPMYVLYVNVMGSKGATTM